MPTYNFKCPQCGTLSEVTMSIKDYAVPMCETCGVGMSQVYDAPGIVFKGTGFYKTGG